MNVPRKPTLTPLPKYMKYAKFPVIVFFDDHHEPFQYYAEDLEEFYDVCLHVLRDRIDSYFSDPGEPSSVGNNVLELDVIEKLPEPYKKDALEKHKDHKRTLAWYENEKNTYNKAKKAIKTKNSVLAFECLESHRNSGDEGFTIRNIEDLRV